MKHFYSSLKGRVYLSGEAKYYNENEFYETVQKEFGINLSKTQIDKTQRKMIENGLGVNLDKMVYNKDLYDQFIKDFHDRGCVTMKDWLREYNLVDVIPFTESIEKTKQYYTELEIDLFKDAVSIPGISYRHVINTYIKNKGPNEPDLYAPSQPCNHTCNNKSDKCAKKTCKECKKGKEECEICPKNKAYELLKTEIDLWG